MNFCPVPHTQRDIAWLGIGIFIGSSLYYFKKSKGEAKSGSEVQRQLSKQDPAGLSQRAAAADGKVYFSYSDVHSSICSLASRIKSEFKPDVIIAIGGGGFIPARMLRTEIKVPILAVSLELYDDSTNTARTTVVRKQWYDIDSELGKLVKGGRVLIVDEVDDTRATLEYCVKEVQKDGPSAICVAVVHNKAKPKKGALPDGVVYLAGEEVPNMWNCYPWDAAAYGRSIYEHEELAKGCREGL